MFVSVFLLSESSDGILVATGCVAEIRLSELGKEEPAAGRELCGAGARWVREQRSHRRGDGKRRAYQWTTVNRFVESSRRRTILQSLLAEGEGSGGSLHRRSPRLV